jgi:hypothetical protein
MMVAVVVLLTLASPHKGIGKRDHQQFFRIRTGSGPLPPPIKKGENNKYERNKICSQILIIYHIFI